MPDDKNQRGQRDRDRIDPNEPYELRHVEQKLGVSREQVLQAIAEVGDNREKVEEYLRNKPNK